ncbi:MAG: cytochrome c [Agriterribacter sp.]
MKKIILFAITLLVIAFGCRQPQSQKPGLLNQQQLATQLFTITTDSDTTINTSGGAIIKIAKGTLINSDNTNKVAIEIKEAFSMEEIIRAGLATQSNGQPLSSGGMIYINAQGGQTIKISKPIAVSIPTPFINNKMQLFKGDTSDNGKINWVEPANLPADTQNTILSNGQQLFANHCASCHAIGKDLTGPDLAHIVERTNNKKLLYAFTRNPALVMHDVAYYRCLKNRFNGVMMTRFPDLSDTVLDNLYSYIENESKALRLPIPQQYTRACMGSCLTYVLLKDKLTQEKNELTKAKIDMIIRDIIDTNPPAPSEPVPTIPSIPAGPPAKEKVKPSNNQSLYYQFTIQTFGWYNIDMLLKDPSTTESSLIVRIRGEYKQNISIWLAVPDFKALLHGGLLANKTDEYGFDNADGTIPLPKNTRAYILALGEYEDKIVFAKKEFFTTSSQQFELSPSIISLQDFNNTMKTLPGSETMNISVNNSKNADTLRKVIKELKDVEKLKPQNCDCDCLMSDSPVTIPVEALDTTKLL